MSNRKRMVADLLFGVQAICALVFAGPYFVRSLSDVTGSSAAQLGLVLVYLMFHLALGFGAHRAAPSRVTRQTLLTYAYWWVLMGMVFLAVVFNPTYKWNGKDTATLLIAIFLTLAVILSLAFAHVPLADPIAKASFAIIYKSIPQALLAWKFLAEGATGTPGLSVVVGHLTILIRLGQIYFMVREAGWDRNRLWLAVSESANELSWVVATIAWLIRWGQT